jgi:hypothetical protein
MRNPGWALLFLATVACRGHDPTSATPGAPGANPPAVVGLQTYLAGSMSSNVDFFLTDLDGDPIAWRASVATMPGCRCTAGTLRLSSIDGRPAGSGAALAGTVRSGTRLVLYYYPGSTSAPNNVNNVLLTIEASDPSGAVTRATIEVPNW